MSFKLAKLPSLALFVGMSLVGCSAEKSFDEYLQSAKLHSEKGQYGAAIVDLKNAVRQNTQHAETRYLLGVAYLKQGNIVSAEKELTRAEELGVDSSLIYPKLARVYMEKRDSEQVYSIVEKGEQLNDVAFVEVLYSAGVVSALDGNNTDAEDFFNQISTIGSSSDLSMVGQSWSYFLANENIKAEETVNKVLEKNPKSIDALMLLGIIADSEKNYQKASEFYQSYVDLKPESFTGRVSLTNALIFAGTLEKAQAQLDFLIKRWPDNPLVNYAQALVFAGQENFQDAKVYSQKALEVAPALLQSKLIAGVSSFRLKDYEQALNYLSAFEGRLKQDHPAIQYLIAAKLELGYIEEVVSQLDLSNLEGIDPSLLQTASAQIASFGEIETAKNLLDSVAKFQPNNANILAQKGLLQLSQQDPAAEESLLQAIELNPELYHVKASLVASYLKSNMDEKARDLALELQATPESRELGLNLEGIILVKQEKLELAKQVFDQAIELNSENIAAIYNKAIIAELQQDFVLAETYLKQVLSINLDHKGALRKLSEVVAIKQQSPKSNIDFLSELVSLNPNNVILVFSLAQNYLLDNQITKAIQSLESLRQSNELTDDYYLLLGDSYLRNKEFGKARQIFKEAIDASPKHYVAILRLAGLLELEKQYSEGERLIANALAQFPNNIRLLMLKGNFEFLRNDKEAVKKTIAQLKALNANHYFAQNLYGQVAMAERQFDAAIEHFSELYQHKPTGLNAMNLARALKFQGKRDEAAKVLELYLDTNKTDGNVRILLAELYKSYNKDKAISHYHVLLEKNPKNAIVLNNLAWIEYERNKNKSALAYIEKAIQIAPNVYQFLDSYGEILVANGQYKKAVQTLEKALKNGCTTDSCYLSLAKSYVELGEKDQATIMAAEIESRETLGKVMALIK